MSRCRLSLVLFVLIALPVEANDRAINRYPSVNHPVYDPEGMVVSQVESCSRIGASVLAGGGNAIDASVSISFCLAVTLPRAGNIGGGGFMLAYIAGQNKTFALDYREMAPPRASRDMYLDANGEADTDRSRRGYLASGTPGTVAGMWEAHSRWGSLPWDSLVQPAVDLARDGIVVSYDLATNLELRRDRLKADAASSAYFFKADGSAYRPGDTLKQTDLAVTLEAIAADGADAFYKGSIAQKIAAAMAQNGGLIDMEALAAYRPRLRDPLTGSYRGFDIVVMPPPSAGGLHVLQMLNMLEHFPVSDLQPASAANIHLLAEVARTAYADRSRHLGDADFYNVPVDWLSSKQYAARRAAEISGDQARRSEQVLPGASPELESIETTHWSIMDQFGNTVANTYTLNFSFGSGVSVPGAGFLLNNEMDDFAVAPGSPDAFGLIGGEANAIVPGKRPLSSMSPTLVFRDGVPVLATGSPGGSRIITAVLQMLVNVIDHGMNIADATHAPRIHHQWQPDVLEVEPGIGVDAVRALRAMGHNVKRADPATSLQSAARGADRFEGAADPRRPAAAAVGPGNVPQ